MAVESSGRVVVSVAETFAGSPSLVGRTAHAIWRSGAASPTACPLEGDVGASAVSC
jgi:hypothetical protein